jgi:hypothetical protein
MRAGEIATAGFLCRREFHQLDSGQIRIEHIQLTLAVAAHLGVFVTVRFPSMRLEESLRLWHVGHSE